MADITLTEKQTRITARDGTISFILHALIFLLIFWLTPLHELIKPQDSTPTNKAESEEPSLSPLAKDANLINEAIDRINMTQSQNATERVSELLDTEKQLDVLVKERIDAFKKEAQELAPAAAQKALETLQKVPVNQTAATQDQTKLADQVKALAAMAANAQQLSDPAAVQAALTQIPQISNAFAQQQNAIKKTQIAAEDEQTQATQTLSFVASQYSDTIDAQQKANATQNAASDSQLNANREEQQTLAAVNKALTAAQLKNNLVTQQAEIDRLNTQQIPADTKQASLTQAQMNQANDAQKLAEATATQTKSPTDATAAKAAQDAATAQKKALDIAQGVLTTDQKNVLRQILQAQLQQTKDQLAQLAAMPDTLPALQGQAEAVQKKAQDDQVAAQQQQADAVAKLTAQQRSPLPTGPMVTAAPAVITEPEPDQSATNGKDLSQLYQLGREAENRIAEKYKTFRAAELAAIRTVSLDEAMKSTQVAKPDREKLDMGLLAAKDAAKNFTAYKEQVTKANQQLDSMVSLSQQMLDVAQKQDKVGQGTINAGDLLKNSGKNFDKMQAMATADDQMVGKDLTVETSGQEGDDAPAKTSGNGSPVLNLQSTEGAQFAQNAPELPTMDYQNLKPLAARRIGSTGTQHADWIYVDSWYLIGPFPNPGRRNLNTKFPPESIVDLDAVYPGKNDQPIRWKFMQWDNPMVRIPHDLEEAPAIYYAFTELMFDQPQDLWIATGSDDKGTMWLNDILIWNSNDNLKGWIPNEGYRKVHFIKGRNRILYRLENAQLYAALSLMISTKTTP